MDKRDNICFSFAVSPIGSCFRIIIRKENYSPRMLTVIWDIKELSGDQPMSGVNIPSQ